MSLINDALKRASQSEKNRPRDNDSPAAMQPAPRAAPFLRPGLGGCLGDSIVGGGWFG